MIHDMYTHAHTHVEREARAEIYRRLLCVYGEREKDTAFASQCNDTSDLSRESPACVASRYIDSFSQTRGGQTRMSVRPRLNRGVTPHKPAR